MFKSYSRNEAELAIRKALDGAKVFESSTRSSSPDAVAAMIARTAREQNVEVTLRLAPKGVLIAHAEHAAAV
jgi:hypothetical protein